MHGHMNVKCSVIDKWENTRNFELYSKKIESLFCSHGLFLWQICVMQTTPGMLSKKKFYFFFYLCHFWRQPVGNKQVANPWTSAPFQRRRKYLQMADICHIHNRGRAAYHRNKFLRLKKYHQHYFFLFGSIAPPPPVDQGHLIHEVSRSHTTTHHSR